MFALILTLLLHVPPGPLQTVVEDYFTTKEIAAMPPIELAIRRPPEMPVNTEGFVMADHRRIIYITTWSDIYQAAPENRYARMKLAAVIVHELYHLDHGPAEGPAYDAECFKLLQLGAPDFVVQQVRRAQKAVLSRKP
jgi:hypothetical protein